jgi:hypothetical protein
MRSSFINVSINGEKLVSAGFEPVTFGTNTQQPSLAMTAYFSTEPTHHQTSGFLNIELRAERQL